MNILGEIFFLDIQISLQFKQLSLYLYEVIENKKIK